MNNPEVHELVFLGVFFTLVFLVPIAVIWASYRPTMAFDITPLWTHQGRIDKFAVIILGTWWVHTSSIIMWTLLRTVQTTDYLTYMGWALPIIARMLAPQNGRPAETPAPRAASESPPPPPPGRVVRDLGVPR